MTEPTRFQTWVHFAKTRTPILLISGAPGVLTGVNRRSANCKVNVNSRHMRCDNDMISHAWRDGEWITMTPWFAKAPPKELPTYSSNTWLRVTRDEIELSYALTQPPPVECLSPMLLRPAQPVVVNPVPASRRDPRRIPPPPPRPVGQIPVRHSM